MMKNNLNGIIMKGFLELSRWIPTYKIVTKNKERIKEQKQYVFKRKTKFQHYKKFLKVKQL